MGGGEVEPLYSEHKSSVHISEVSLRFQWLNVQDVFLGKQKVSSPHLSVYSPLFLYPPLSLLSLSLHLSLSINLFLNLSTIPILLTTSPSPLMRSCLVAPHMNT